MTPPPQSQRADKWLHQVRIFKTRALATQACGKGQVTLSGQPVKASRDLKMGDVLEVLRGDLRLRLRVLAFPAQRLSASGVPAYCENQTPKEWIQAAAQLRREKALITPKPHEMLTKPNKQQLRQLRVWREQNEGV
jgi:ribosome-associated heat shock protein Hsp15